MSGTGGKPDVGFHTKMLLEAAAGGEKSRQRQEWEGGGEGAERRLVQYIDRMYSHTASSMLGPSRRKHMQLTWREDSLVDGWPRLSGQCTLGRHYCGQNDAGWC